MSPKTRKAHEDLEAGFAALAAAERSGRISAAPLPAPLLARILADAAEHGRQTGAAHRPTHRPTGFGFWAKLQAGLSAAFEPLTGGLAMAGLAGLMGFGLGLWGGGADGALQGLEALWGGGVETVELWPEGAGLLEEG